jgi:predicted nuclease with RNAse H fold
VRSLGLGAPKSPYQVTGAGAVGSSTIRGMPVLRVLRALGAAIWPFDAPSTVTVIECYPRIATGRDVVKRDPAARTAWLRRHRDLTAAHRRAAQDSDDAFDALAAARWLWRHRDAIARSPRAVDDAQRIEGAIWVPPSLLPTPGAA